MGTQQDGDILRILVSTDNHLVRAVCKFKSCGISVKNYRACADLAVK